MCGGVAGCEAARVLALRGHKPKLFEKGKRLGGNLLPSGGPELHVYTAEQVLLKEKDCGVSA